jgi:hypothetical protein
MFFTQFTIVQDSEDTIKAVMMDWCSCPTSLSVLSMQFLTQGLPTLKHGIRGCAGGGNPTSHVR